MKRTLLLAVSAILALLPAKMQADDIAISNSRVSMSFAADGKQFAVRSFCVGGHNLLDQKGSQTPLWTITVLGPHGELADIQPRHTNFDGGVASASGHRAIFFWSLGLSKKETSHISVCVNLPSDDSELPEWTISATLPKGWKITALEFPRLSVCRPDGIKGIMPVGYGAEYPLGQNDMIQSRYPSCTGTMEFVLGHNGSETFYFAALDNQGASKLMQLKAEGPMLTFVQKLECSYAWTSDDGRFELPWPTVLGYNPDTWEQTLLKWYRPFSFGTAWGSKTLAERQIASWMPDADIWLRPMGVTPETMDAVREGLKRYGEGVGLHWYYWHSHPFDTYYPEYFPDQPGFKDMVAEAQSMGAHVTPYINGRLWDPATESYDSLGGYTASCRRPDGTLYSEIYGSKVVNTVTCPSSELWQGIIRDLNRRILDSLGTHGVYIDQIGCAAGQPCYAENHSHAPGAGSWWPQAYRELLTGMRRDIYTPDQAVTTEENAECYLDLFDMMLVVNGPHSEKIRQVPCFPLVYSDRCITSGMTYIPGKINGGQLIFLTAQSLLWGAQLGWVEPVQLFKPENAREAEFLGTMGAFRKANHDIFCGGRFMGDFVPGGDNPEFVAPGYWKVREVLGAKWTSVAGESCLVLVNMGGKEHNVTLPDGSSVTVPAGEAIRINTQTL